MFPEHVLKPLQAFLRLLASQESRSLLLVGELVKMLLDIARLDQKEPENGMAAVGAMRCTWDAGAVLLLHVLEGSLCSVCQPFVGFEKIVLFFHDFSKRLISFPPTLLSPSRGEGWVGGTP